MKNGTLFLVALLSSSIGGDVLAETILLDEKDRDFAHIEQVVVTSTREEKKLNHLSESVGVLTEQDLIDISPAHPADALNRIAGVHINNLGGEGHMTSIRQPISTSGVYLFLEDGLPTRPSGFFNHNGLYEINIPQSGRLEVIKGPGSALYGSDAIGGVINVITKKPPVDTELNTNIEIGSDQWRRALLSFGGGNESLAAKVDVSLTESEGFRDEADYDRQSVTLRLDSKLSAAWNAKVIASYSTIDQSGVSSLEEGDYRGNTSKNRFHDDIGFRQVDAFRLSSEFNYEINDSQLFTFTPFYRNNEMTMMPSWMVTYDPNIRGYEFESYGAQIKFRQFFLDERVEFISGFDIDNTPSSYLEEAITATLVDDIYTNYDRTGELNYDFEAQQESLSPYIHVEYQLTDKWRLNAGARYDYFEVDYDNHLSVVEDGGSHGRPASKKIDYENTSPKLGATYQYLPNNSMYLSYRHAFRAPTVGALFRSGSSFNTSNLKPVTSVSVEIGFRGKVFNKVDYEIAYYDMTVEEDIVSVIIEDDRYPVNAGETRHKGIEVGLDYWFDESLSVGLSYTKTDQTYEDFSYTFFSRTCFCQQEINFAGNDVVRAPESLANIRIAYLPRFVDGFRVELEWDMVGDYYTDQLNTQTYGGHDLLNLRVNYDINDDLSVYARVANITDELYSTYTSNQVNDPDVSYRPGRPRSGFVGVRWNIK